MATQNRIVDEYVDNYLVSTPVLQWFATNIQHTSNSDELRFRFGARCADGDVTLLDFYFVSDMIEKRRVSGTRKELLQLAHDHIVKELATLELEKE